MSNLKKLSGTLKKNSVVEMAKYKLKHLWDDRLGAEYWYGKAYDDLEERQSDVLDIMWMSEADEFEAEEGYYNYYGVEVAE